jgi:tRNA dimethylallyltransferase
MADMARRGKVCVLVGGTGLYFRALTQGLADLPSRNEPLRTRLRKRITTHGAPALYRILQRFDPPAASRIMPEDEVRIIRALEVRLLTGRPLSSWIETSPFGSESLAGVLQIGLTASRPFLYERIDARVDTMMASGLLGEVEALHQSGALRGPARKAIGYGELADHIEGACTLRQAVDRIKLRSRHLAKRQLTWFRKETGVKWYYIDHREAWKNDAMEFIERWAEEAKPRP